MIVLDASVALKWFIDEEGSESARRILLDLQESPTEFIVPELFFIEMLSVLSRYGLTVKQLAGHMESLESLGIQRISLGQELMLKACEIISETKISAYDAVYAATAFLCKGIWITADKTAHLKISKFKISKILENIA